MKKESKSKLSSKPKKKKKKKSYNHCVKRYSLRINNLKWLMLLEIASSYAHQKDYFLTQYGGLKNISSFKTFRAERNLLVSKDYDSPFGLQKRGWKLALKDSLETQDRYWAALKTSWKRSIAKSNLSDEEKHYLFLAIYNRLNIDLVYRFGAKVKFGLNLTINERKKCIRFLKNLIKKTVKDSPRVKLIRSFLAEPETYRVFEHNGRQYIAITTLEKGNRLCIPLKGKMEISGQIRIVLDFEKNRIEIHQIVKTTRNITPPEGKKIGVDWGITEVLTDSDGDRWGKDFGTALNKYSDELKNKGKKRNKIYANAKKHKKNLNHKKYSKIKKNNLGRKKQNKRKQKRKIHLSNIINRALNEFLKEKDPKIVCCEDISNMRGKAQSKKMSRLVSLWIRNILSERFEFKVLQRGSLQKRVNPAYSSQICPICGWVHRSNRNGDAFKCTFCGFKAPSDLTGALEILRRANDKEISLWIRKEEVKRILLSRFRNRLEKWDFSLELSQVHWDKVRSVLGNSFIDSIIQKHSISK